MQKTHETRAIRRVVTGHNSVGKSVLVEDRNCPFIFAMPSVPGLVVTDLWRSFECPADNLSTAAVGAVGRTTLPPPPHGSVFRVVQFPPDKDYMDRWDAHAQFAAMGHQTDGTEIAQGRTVGMHKTDSLDYAIVLSGEIWAVMDEGETLLKPGDVLVQRGTNHGWSVRSDEPALVAFILLDALPQPAGVGAL